MNLLERYTGDSVHRSCAATMSEHCLIFSDYESHSVELPGREAACHLYPYGVAPIRVTVCLQSCIPNCIYTYYKLLDKSQYAINSASTISLR